MNSEQIKIGEHRKAEHMPVEDNPLCAACEEKPVGYIEVNWENQRWYQDELCSTCRKEIGE